MLANLSSFIPAAFPPLALAHFLALLSPGPYFSLIIDRSVRHRLCGAVFICLGIALNAVYIALAAAGWAVLRQLLAGLGSALLNPKNAICYLILMTVILGPNTTPAQQILPESG